LETWGHSSATCRNGNVIKDDTSDGNDNDKKVREKNNDENEEESEIGNGEDGDHEVKDGNDDCDEVGSTACARNTIWSL